MATPESWNFSPDFGTSITLDTTNYTIGDASIKFESSNANQLTIAQSFIPVEPLAPYTLLAKLRADDITAGNTMTVIVEEYQGDKVTSVGAPITPFNAVLNATNTWEWHGGTFNTSANTRYVAIGVLRSANAFNGWVDSVLFYKAPRSFRVYDGTGTSMGATAWTLVEFDTNVYEYGLDFDTVTNNDFTCALPGVYHFDAGIEFTGVTSGSTMGVALYVDTGGGAAIHTIGEYDATQIATPVRTVSADIYLDYGSKVTVYGYNGDASARTLSAASTDTWFSGHRVQ